MTNYSTEKNMNQSGINKQNIPKLRFPDFHDEWVEYKLNELATEIKRKKDHISENDNILTISAKVGFISQQDRFNQIIAGNSLKKYNYLMENEFSYNRGNSKSYPYGCIYKLNYPNALVPTVYRSFKINKGEPLYFEQLFKGKKLDKQLKRIITSTARMDGLLNISSKDFFNVKLFVSTSMDEQKKIGEFLHLCDQKINLMKKKYDDFQEFKKYLLQNIFAQKLRFDFNDEWEFMKFDDIFKTISTKKYQIKSAEISDVGEFEVVDQGQSNIAGYFDDKSKLFVDLPVIIYGDHTTFVKFRNKPFIVGADGVKILTSKINSNLNYLFYALEQFNIEPEGYKRHFSIIRKIELPIPSLNEQNEISKLLSNVDKKINLLHYQISHMEEFKRGLLQSLFI